MSESMQHFLKSLPSPIFGDSVMRSSSLAAKYQQAVVQPFVHLLQNHCFSFVASSPGLVGYLTWSLIWPHCFSSVLAWIVLFSFTTWFLRETRHLLSPWHWVPLSPQSLAGVCCSVSWARHSFCNGEWVAALPEFFGGKVEEKRQFCPRERKYTSLLIKRHHFLQFPLISEISLLRGL